MWIKSYSARLRAYVLYCAPATYYKCTSVQHKKRSSQKSRSVPIVIWRSAFHGLMSFLFIQLNAEQSTASRSGQERERSTKDERRMEEVERDQHNVCIKRRSKKDREEIGVESRKKEEGKTAKSVWKQNLLQKMKTRYIYEKREEKKLRNIKLNKVLNIKKFVIWKWIFKWQLVLCNLKIKICNLISVRFPEF